MIRSLTLAALAALIIGVAAPGSTPADEAGADLAPQLAQGGLIQCMEQCVRHEGGNTAANRETCKLRCAQVPTAGAGPGGGRDCMAPHKDCLAACGRDRGCRQACRKRLMNCK